MNTELYSYDSYKGYDIFITLEDGIYYGDIKFKGEYTLQDLLISGDGDWCLQKCEDWIDEVLEE
jgi:hypothetical protein